MLDVKWIREAPEALDHALRRRGLTPMAERIVALDERRRAAIADSQALQSARNKAAKEIGAAKGRGEDVQPLIARLGADRQAQDDAEVRAAGLESELDALIASLPNPPADDVPDGADADANREVRRVGEPARFNFPARQHDELGALFGLMDFAAAARMSGARFVVLKGALARLERALAQLMLDIHTKEFGYLEISPPLLVRDGAAFGTGQLPKFRDDLFQTTDGFWLIPTAEVPLTNLAADAILEEGDLPLRFTAWTPCFRSEAGAAGKDTRGMIRQHQFSKVELVSIAHPDGSADEHERMTGCAEVILKRLGLPYRVVVLATGDMGFSARKTYDIEVWLPGQNTYREISSCSNCGDFQARRMKARFRAAGEKGTRFVHTLNGSGLAIGRTLIAILENGQRADGSVALPEALHPYMDGRTVIGPHA